MASTHVNPHAMALLRETILCTRCGRTQKQITEAEESRRLCNAPLLPPGDSAAAQGTKRKKKKAKNKEKEKQKKHEQRRKRAKKRNRTASTGTKIANPVIVLDDSEDDRGGVDMKDNSNGGDESSSSNSSDSDSDSDSGSDSEVVVIEQPAGPGPVASVAAAVPSIPSLSYTPSPAIFEQYGDFTLEAKVENFPAASPPQVFSVNPRLPRGVTIDTKTGRISGSAIGSGGARHEHTASFTITARDASSKVSASFQLILSFVDKQLRPNLGTCVACMEVVQETVERRAACCPTKTDERPEGRHVYCHDCFQALVRAEMSALPLVCRACGDNPQPQQEQAQDQAQAQAAAAAPAPPAPAFEDSEIMRALGDKARVRYCELVKEALPPFHVRVKCAARGCNWEARIPEKKVDDLILCERKNCARLTCRDCETVVEFKGQGQWAGQHIDAAATNRYNDIVVDEHLIVCALRKRIEDVCTFGLCVRCPTCGTRTQKNEACSHMICRNPKCGTRYCYCCGLARIDCDGAGANNWGVHNSNWTRNPLRCPMYLEQIHSVDPTWPATPEGALAQLHKEQVLRHLQRLLKHADPGVYEAILTARYGAYTRDAVTSFAERPFFRNRRMPPL